jgi:hypothetical protein
MTQVLKLNPSPQKKNLQKLALWSNNFLSNWFFLWVAPILSRANQRLPLTFSLRRQETARVNVDALEAAFDRQITNNDGKASIYAALYEVFGREYAAIAG